MNGYETSPATPQRYNWTHRRQGTPLCLFTNLPKYISRQGAENGLIDRQELESIGSEWLIADLKGYTMPIQP